MGSILRKKLTSQPAVADDTKGLAPLWDGFGRLVTRRLEEEELGAVLIKSVSTRRMTLDVYRAEHDSAQAIFRMGSKAVPVACIGHVSHALASMVTGKKLGDDEADAASYEPSTLDILLLQPLMSELFHGFSRACSGLDRASPFAGATYQGGMTRLSALEVDDERMEMLVLTFTLSIGMEKEADLTFLLPYQPVEKLSNLLANAPAQSVNDPEDPWPPHMYDAVLSGRVTLMALLDSIPMTVAECSRLQVDHVIPLPGVSLNELTIAARGEHGHLGVATGALGVMKQFKAVKLMTDPPEDFIAGFAKR